jgi:hypothetical protein
MVFNATFNNISVTSTIVVSFKGGESLRRGHVRMVVGFKTTYSVSAYHH